MDDSTLLAFGLVYVLPLLGALLVYRVRRRRRLAAGLRARADSEAVGLAEPVSLHPSINPIRCLGCGACARACPEGDVLGLVDGRAELLNPTSCIGHGACQTACPFDAITLVLGSERRGVDIPMLGPDFQTNVPGVYVAGELGGMGLVRNAVAQGRQAVDAIATRARGLPRAELDLVIVGAGPAGIAATLAARERGLRAVTLEQESVGGSVMHYPRRKLVTTAPVALPLGGRLAGWAHREGGAAGLLDGAAAARGSRDPRGRARRRRSRRGERRPRGPHVARAASSAARCSSRSAGAARRSAWASPASGARRWPTSSRTPRRTAASASSS